MKTQNVHYIFLQETYFTDTLVDKILKEWKKGSCIHCLSVSTHGKGVSILFRKHLDGQIIDTYETNDGRCLLVNVNIGQLVVTLVNIYTPAQESKRKAFLERSIN